MGFSTQLREAILVRVESATGLGDYLELHIVRTPRGEVGGGCGLLPSGGGVRGRGGDRNGAVQFEERRIDN